MGASTDTFVKYPRTPHLFGAKGTDDDRRLGMVESTAFVSNPTLIVEEKLDGTNVGIHFTSAGRMVLQCRGHEITSGMHPQYDLFKRWVMAKQPVMEEMLANRYILFGEWLYAKHSVHYTALPHYFYEFDIYDKLERCFLSLDRRLAMLEGRGIHTVPVVHRGKATQGELLAMIGESAFGALFDNPLTQATDTRMEGLYLRTEAGDRVSARAKMVRPEFVEKVKQSEHWQHQQMVPNKLVPGADLWS